MLEHVGHHCHQSVVVVSVLARHERQQDEDLAGAGEEEEKKNRVSEGGNRECEMVGVGRKGGGGDPPLSARAARLGSLPAERLGTCA